MNCDHQMKPTHSWWWNIPLDAICNFFNDRIRFFVSVLEGVSFNNSSSVFANCSFNDWRIPGRCFCVISALESSPIRDSSRYLWEKKFKCLNMIYCSPQKKVSMFDSFLNQNTKIRIIIYINNNAWHVKKDQVLCQVKLTGPCRYFFRKRRKSNLKLLLIRHPVQRVLYDFNDTWN